MHNIKLRIAYDGKNYLGWQKTGMGPSIESELQRVLEQILQQPILLQAASRTDAGVHALGQIVNFTSSQIPANFEKFVISLNCLLPKDITILEATEMPIHFHPTIDCIGKEYRYFVCLGPIQLPHNRLYSWHVYYDLDREKMEKAIGFFIGSHSYASFCNFKKNAHYSDMIREVRCLEITEWEDSRLCFRIQGNHFLYKMVRNIVGTLIDVGKGKIAVDSLRSVMESGDRTKAGVTAPAHGLFLHSVFYS